MVETRETQHQFSYYDNLRASLANSTTVVVEQKNGSSVLKVNGDRLIHVDCAFGYSQILPPPNNPVIWRFLISSSKGVIMAAHDFNNRNSSIVPKLQELTKGCNVKMTLDFYDTLQSARHGAKVLGQKIHRKKFPYETTAVLGAVRSAVSIPMAILNRAKQMPQISFASTSPSLDEPTYSLFGRVVPSSVGDAAAAIDFLVQRLRSTHFGILYVNDEYGSGYRKSLEQAAALAGIQTQSVGLGFSSTAVSADSGRGSVTAAVDVLLGTGYRHFVAIIFSFQLQELIEVGAPRGLFGPGRFWMFGDAIASEDLRSEAFQYDQGSPQAQALEGMALISAGSATIGGHYDRFLKSFEALNDDTDFLQHFESKTPLSPAVNFTRDHDFGRPSQYPPLAYDAVIALGIAACNCKDFFTGVELFDEFRQLNFIGASGTVVIHPKTGSRLFNSSAYVILNTLLGKPDKNGKVGVRIVSSAEYAVDENGGVQWLDTEAQFIYAGGSMVPPPALPLLVQDDSYSQTSFIIFNVFGALLMFLAVGFAVWTWHNRRCHVVMASQPGFLLVICLGVFIMAFSLIVRSSSHPPQSYDFANFSCMADYWFFFFGFGLAMSALYAKTWRVVRILGKQVRRFQRIVVKPKDVIRPLLFFVFGNLLIILVWQLVDPLRFERIGDTDGGVDRFGRYTEAVLTCKSEKGWSKYFLAALFVLNSCMIVASNIMSYRARHLRIEFSESRYVGLATGIILQALILSLPVLFFEETESAAAIIARQVITTIIVSCILFLIFIPKVSAWRSEVKHRRKRDESRKRKRTSALQEENAASADVQDAVEPLSRTTGESTGSSANPSTTTSPPRTLFQFCFGVQPPKPGDRRDSFSADSTSAAEVPGLRILSIYGAPLPIMRRNSFGRLSKFGFSSRDDDSEGRSSTENRSLPFFGKSKCEVDECTRAPPPMRSTSEPNIRMDSVAPDSIKRSRRNGKVTFDLNVKGKNGVDEWMDENHQPPTFPCVWETPQVDAALQGSSPTNANTQHENHNNNNNEGQSQTSAVAPLYESEESDHGVLLSVPEEDIPINCTEEDIPINCTEEDCRIPSEDVIETNQ